MRKSKTSLLPLFILVTPLAILYPLPAVRLLWALLLTIYAGGRLYSGRIRKCSRVSRTTPVDRLFFGEEGFVELLVENNSRLPAANLLVEDRPDFDLAYGGTQRFLISLGGREKRRLRYPVRGLKRGQFLVRGYTVSGSDLFGQFPWETFHNRNDIITVYPRIFPLHGLFRNYRQPFGSLRNKFPIFEDPSRSEGIRPWQSGDALRRINWKQSARSGSLLVNTLMPSISRRTLLLVNLHETDYNFRYKEFYSELALELAASLAALLHQEKQEFGLHVRGELRELFPAPEGVPTEERRQGCFREEPRRGGRQLRAILELLAKLHPQSEASLAEELSTARFEPGGRTSLVILTPDLDQAAATAVGALKQEGVDPAVLLFGPGIRKGYGLARFNIPVLWVKRDEGLLVLEPLHE